MKERRDAWKAGQPALDSKSFIFVDETWASTNMTRSHGRCPRGERLVMGVPHGHWKTTTFVVGLRAGGLVAPTVVDGPMTGDVFVAYVRQQLVPTLRPGDVVVMDNLSSHKRVATRELIRACGAEVLYLPPYSPDLNPIEMAFSKVKNELRRRRLRTVDELWAAFGESLDWVAPDEARRYFEHAGYAAQ